MSASSLDVVVTNDTMVDSHGDGERVGIKRKRTPSPSGEREAPRKRSWQQNGSMADTKQSSEDEGERERERVAILDAGAQYGKVRSL